MWDKSQWESKSQPSILWSDGSCIFCALEYYTGWIYKALIIGYGRFLSCMGAVWHPQCSRCHAYGEPISEHEFSMSGNDPHHKSCYKEIYHPKCDVCNHFIPTNRAGLIEYRAHPFWGQRYCPSHEHDNTPWCCRCERMEAMNVQNIKLDDGRKLCLQCLDSTWNAST